MHIYNQLESDNVDRRGRGVARCCWSSSLVVLVALDLLQRWAARRG